MMHMRQQQIILKKLVGKRILLVFTELILKKIYQKYLNVSAKKLNNKKKLGFFLKNILKIMMK